MKRIVVVWDRCGNGLQWLAWNGRLEDMEIILLDPSDMKNDSFFTRQEWDYLLIFEEGMRVDCENVIQELGLPRRFIVYSLDYMSWVTHPAAWYTLLKYNNEPYNAGNKWGRNYIACTVEGVSYVGSTTDHFIMPYMLITGKNMAQDEMIAFQELAHTYYVIDESAGWFFDLGANIGTSGIYFIKKLAPSLKLLAFEPDSDNYRILQANLLINKMNADDAIVERMGLGAVSGVQTLYKNPWNPGSNGMYPVENGLDPSMLETEMIQIVTLDDYIASHDICPKDIRYIWIDVEGYEAQLIVGAKDFLSRYAPPLLMEFSPAAWRKSGYYDAMMDVLNSSYTHFIRVQEYKSSPQNARAYPITELWEFYNSDKLISVLGDIFLLNSRKHS